MNKRFKSKKVKRKIKFQKIFFLLIIGFVIYKILTSIFFSFKITNSNQNLLKLFLADSNHHILSVTNTNLFKIINPSTNIVVKTPIQILENTFQYKLDTKKVFNEEQEFSEEVNPSSLAKYFADPNPSTVEEPEIYIYNTHQLESYSTEGFENYEIVPSVLTASYLLKEKLNKLNIKTIVETADIKEFLSLNSWDYSSSYKASRFYVMDALEKNKNLKLIIDLHRDSGLKESTTAIIDEKKYAKIMFVVGLENTNYEPNLKLAKELNSLIDNNYVGLSRGIITKKGVGVDGIYNQDLSTKMILIEIGGQESSMVEVMNTIEALTNIIKKYIGDNNEA